jgi:AraC-like DNA-binding protein
VRVERARVFLDAHATQRVSLDTIPELAGVSKYHCIRLFNRVLGVSPHAYQLQRRIDFGAGAARQGALGVACGSGDGVL